MVLPVVVVAITSMVLVNGGVTVTVVGTAALMVLAFAGVVVVVVVVAVAVVSDSVSVAVVAVVAVDDVVGTSETSVAWLLLQLLNDADGCPAVLIVYEMTTDVNVLPSADCCKYEQ